jgi:Rrf2 family transcriptional regulator, nitric oxide-sensitive transcriptional repressor
MFSQTVEYALRAVTYLAQNCEAACTTEQIAKATSVPQAYLAKVLQSLLRSGITQSQRGIKGGIRLARSAEELSMLDVVQAVDPIKRIDHCPLPTEGEEINGHSIRNREAHALCPLHQKLDEALGAVESLFRTTTLHHLVEASKAGNPLCHSSPAVNGHEKLNIAG